MKLRCFRATVTVALLLVLPVWAVSPSVPQLPDPGHPGMSKEKQEQVGIEYMGEVYKQVPVLPDSSPITEYVRHLGERLASQIPSQYSWPYQFHVIEQKDINAFALPGGPIFINVGTIITAQNEAQLAGVMAHEMSHVYMQHSAKQESSPKRTIAEILGAAGALGGGVLGGLARFGAGTLLLRYSRGDEAQADAVGAIIMYKAGYNPIELANFFEILNRQGGNPPQFLSDHPNPGNRTAAISKEIRNWPRRTFNTDSQQFASIRDRAKGVSAYSAQQISDGAKQGRWARENMQAGAVPESARQTVSESIRAATVSNVSFDQIRPSPDFTTARQNDFSISYPSNWTAAAGRTSLTVAPRAGVSQNAIAYGVAINEAEDRDANSLDQVMQDLIRNLQQSNTGMKQRSDVRSTNLNGVSGRVVDLMSDSPILSNGMPLPERDQVVLLPQSNGGFVYLIFIAPEKDFDALQPTFRKMLDSLRVQ